MVTTNVKDVSQDGVIYELELLVREAMQVSLKRHTPDEAFEISEVNVYSSDENTLTLALNEINKILSEHGISELVVQSSSGEPLTLCI